MRCARCHRRIDPANAIAAMGRTFGPTCAQRLGFVTAAPNRPRKPSNFAIFGPRTAVRVDDGQADLFGVAA